MTKRICNTQCTAGQFGRCPHTAHTQCNFLQNKTKQNKKQKQNGKVIFTFVICIYCHSTLMALASLSEKSSESTVITFAYFLVRTRPELAL